MFRDYRESVAQGAFAGLYVGAWIFGFSSDAENGLLLAAAFCVVPAFVAWILSFRRLRIMQATPTSRIASAAQGYVELFGRGVSPPDFQVLSKLTGLPCIWYRYTVEERTGSDKWKQIDSGRSTESFLLDDGSGVCVVDPEHAEVLARKKEVRTRGDFRYTEWLIPPNDRVYVIGAFATLGGANLELDEKHDVGEVLADWKRSRQGLLKRFDLDRDGQIGEKEWMLARAQARREVKKRHSELRAQPGTHVMEKPRDGRLFLISDLNPDNLVRRYKFWAWLHLAVFLVTVGMTANLVAVL